MVCEDKTRLITAYAVTTERYAISAAKLRTTPGSQLQKALAVSETARAECVKARRALQEHKAEHGCFSK